MLHPLSARSLLDLSGGPPPGVPPAEHGGGEGRHRGGRGDGPHRRSRQQARGGEGEGDRLLGLGRRLPALKGAAFGTASSTYSNPSAARMATRFPCNLLRSSFM